MWWPRPKPGPPFGSVPFTRSVMRCCRSDAIVSAWACVRFPAETAAAMSFFASATSAAISPSADFPLVAFAICASVLPDSSCVRKSACVSPRYVAAESRLPMWKPRPGPPLGSVPFTRSVKRCCRLDVIASACDWVSFPDDTALAISCFSAATSAAIRPAADLPLVAFAICASVLPDSSCVRSSVAVTPRYVAAASRSSSWP